MRVLGALSVFRGRQQARTAARACSAAGAVDWADLDGLPGCVHIGDEPACSSWSAAMN
jgi:hypothetical protein